MMRRDRVTVYIRWGSEELFEAPEGQLSARIHAGLELVSYLGPWTEIALEAARSGRLVELLRSVPCP